LDRFIKQNIFARPKATEGSPERSPELVEGRSRGIKALFSPAKPVIAIICQLKGVAGSSLGV